MSEPVLRLSAFVSVLLGLIVWEILDPRRARVLPRRARWPANLGLVVLNTAAVRVLFPLGAAGGALWAARSGWGLFNLIEAPAWMAFLGSVVVLDLAIYAQHVAMHRVPALWRLHRVHHADLDVDVSTGVRFHPLEIVLSMGFKVALVVGLGAPAAAVIAFEIILNATSMFNHANVGIAPGLDRSLRAVIVTPDMHRIHHSIRREETDSNFGFNVSWWDRLFRTYRDQPKDGQLGLTPGLGQFREPRELRLDRMLLQPFRNPPAVRTL